VRHLVGCNLELVEAAGVTVNHSVNRCEHGHHVGLKLLDHRILRKHRVGARDECCEIFAVLKQTGTGSFLTGFVATGTSRGVVNKEADVGTPQLEERFTSGLAIDGAD
jgi:hypothetical protein